MDTGLVNPEIPDNGFLVPVCPVDAECCQVLLDAGADPSMRDNFNKTALFDACKAGQDGIIELLRKNKAE